MKKTVSVLIVVIAMLSSLALLQGCTNTGQEGDTPASAPAELSPENSENGSRPDPEHETVPATPPEEDEGLLQEILLEYGATYEYPDENRMKTQVLSLYYADAWTEPEELSTGAYYSWFLTTVWGEELTDQELEERYTLPDRDGWAFPEAIYEARIQSRFNVSIEYLRSDETLYHPEEGVYWLGAGGGVGMRPYVELQSVRREDDLLLCVIALEYEEEYQENQTWQLTVQLDGDGGWKYRSWVRLETEPVVEGEAAE